MNAAGDAAALPFAGVRILEMAHHASGPMASMILAQQGADVVKVEPLSGDPLRGVGVRKNGTSALFANISRGKRSIALDIKNPSCQDIIRELAKGSDIVICNFRQGVMERLGLASDRLRDLNPALIYVAVWGYGTTGPLADSPAFDTIMQAKTGFSAIQGSDDEPEFLNTLICDKITAFTAAQAATAALYAREKTGRGQHIDLSMMDASLYFMWPDGMSEHTFLSEDIEQAPPLSKVAQKYKTADGYITIGSIEDRDWLTVFNLIGNPGLIKDPRFSTMISRFENVDVLVETVSHGLRNIGTKHAIETLSGAGVGCAALQGRADVLQDEQVRAVGAYSERSHPVLGPMNVVSPPTRFGGMQSDPGNHCPMVGEHTLEILEEARLSREAIEELFASGLVASPSAGLA